ncbi:hypothetical protein HH213_17795 [Duganella dendranthematis]|uniref:Uncharacterized protein n=1 Tax=Duganella dendranthematis TaxID=2728021 RepID=A0ABX6MBR9_9BURK|nr:hypothetical protein [Duganella dendranthematis]QJD91777.1 hypothetical protein HH213_17795 [Duganella dendranthematis]
MKFIAHVIVAITISSGLLACGGGSGGGSFAYCADGTTTESAGKQGACSHHGGLATTPTTPTTPPVVVTPPVVQPSVLYRGFKKPVISGLNYTDATGQSGTTDKDGLFPVTVNGTKLLEFHIGSIRLYQMTELNAQAFTLENLYQLEFFAVSGIPNDDAVQNLLAFLMIVDDDGDLANGVNIPSAVVNAAAGLSINFNVSSASFYADSSVQKTVQLLSSHTSKGVRPLPPLTEVKAASR